MDDILNFKRDEKTKVLIASINNHRYVPEYFMISLIEMFNFTMRFYPNTFLQIFKAPQVNHMRNMACTYAQENNFDYFIQLDVDHKYPRDTIVRLMQHKKDFVTGITRQRVPPFWPTQYKEFIPGKFKTKENRMFLDDKKELTQIGSTGVPGALIKTEILKKIKYPYFKMIYRDDEQRSTVGGDVYFCKQLSELKPKIELWADPTIFYDHEVSCFVTRGGEIVAT